MGQPDERTQQEDIDIGGRIILISITIEYDGVIISFGSG
jgi:hypothetical protein